MEGLTRLRVGMVGCGDQGDVAQAVAKSNALQVTACANPDWAAAAQLVASAGDAAVLASVETAPARRSGRCRRRNRAQRPV